MRQLIITYVRCSSRAEQCDAPKINHIGGAQERHREWYQSKIKKHLEDNNIYNHIHS